MSRHQSALAGSLMMMFGLAVLIVTYVQADTGREAYLTFSSPVALPGVTLGPGTYLFERSRPMRATATGVSVVRVSTGDGPIVLLAAETKPTERPETLPRGREVVFAETPTGSAPAIAAWFPHGGRNGHKFIYGSRTP